MKKITLALLALVLVFGLSQCKKNVETVSYVQSNGVHITLYVDGGSRADVTPANGQVTFATGDVIYVGNDEKYCGSLSYSSGAFSGTVTPTSEEDYLHFYFAGGLTPSTTPTAGTTTSFTVSIANQSSSLPVLSYGKSTVKYTSSATAYTSTLLNKCALVKFALTNGTDEDVTVAGMKTTATIDFATPGITPTATTGEVTLYSESDTEKWAILLPQDAVDDATVTIGSADYTADVPAIAANDYVTSGIEIDNAPAVDYVFSVSGSKTVHFSPGNLQYKSGEGWRFAEHQYDVIGSWNTSDWVDLFGWGTWGEGKNPLNESTNYEDYQWSTDFQGMLDGYNDWFTLSKDQWQYILDNSTMGRSSVAGVNGYVIRPDGNTTAVSSSYTAEAWAVEEAAGSVFLPAAGYRGGTNVYGVGDNGRCWSSTPEGGNHAWYLYNDYVANVDYGGRQRGNSVRLVR